MRNNHVVLLAFVFLFLGSVTFASNDGEGALKRKTISVSNAYYPLESTACKIDENDPSHVVVHILTCQKQKTYSYTMRLKPKKYLGFIPVYQEVVDPNTENAQSSYKIQTQKILFPITALNSTWATKQVEQALQEMEEASQSAAESHRRMEAIQAAYPDSLGRAFMQFKDASSFFDSRDKYNRAFRNYQRSLGESQADMTRFRTARDEALQRCLVYVEKLFAQQAERETHNLCN
jgi:hypothetical protein